MSSLGNEIREGVASFLATRKQISDEREQEARRRYYNALTNKAEKPDPKGGLSEGEQGIFDQGRAASPFSVGAIPEPPASPVTSSGNTLPKFAQSSGEPGRFGVPDSLWAAQIHQESGGKQFNENGQPLTSRRGATGVAQVMPDTAPEAARLAGVPFDSAKYRNDAEYNDTLGRAYMGAQLKKFGDPAKALAAYNAGPEMVSRVVASYGDRWLNYLPDETRNYVARITSRVDAPSQQVLALAQGGLVDGGYMESGFSDPNAESALPADPVQHFGDEHAGSGAPAYPQEPARDYAPDPLRDLADGIGDVLRGGLSYLQDTFGLTGKGPSAVPESSDYENNARRFHSGEGAMSPEDVQAVTNAVDPAGELRHGLANAAGMRALYNHYVQLGDVGRARAMAGSMLQHFSNLSAQYGDEAFRLMHAGDMRAGLDKLKAGYEAVPDGRSLQITPNAGGTYDLTQRDATGRVTGSGRATPQDLLSYAFQLRDKGAYWQSLIDSATNKHYSAQAQSDPEFDRYVGGLAEQEAQRGAVPTESAPIGAALQPGVTQAGNTRSALPLSPEQDQRSQVVNSAIREYSQANPEPRLPGKEQLLQMQPENQRRVQSAFMAEHRDWVKGRDQAIALANKSFEDNAKAAKTQSTIPTIQTRRHLDETVRDAVENFKSRLPDGVTMSPVQERGLHGAAYGIAASNNIPPSDAVFIVDELAGGRNKAIAEATALGDGRMQARLKNGATVILDPQAYAAIRQLRIDEARKVKSKQDANWERTRGIEAAGQRMQRGADLVMDNAALPRAAKAYGEMVPGLMDWAREQWDAYQKSKPSRTVTLDD
jgi:soluble lytic murein transglycosylase-like protein